MSSDVISGVNYKYNNNINTELSRTSSWCRLRSKRSSTFSTTWKYNRLSDLQMTY